MVTARDTGSKAAGFRLRFDSYLTGFGTTITLRRITQTKDSMDRVLTTTATESTITADIQWATKQDLLHLNVGDVEIGDGMLFCKYNANIELEDEFEYNDIRYIVTSQIEGELVKGKVVYKGFMFRKNAQT